MTILFQSTITVIGPEVAELLEGGVLILFRDGSPAELAEVSVLHIETVPASASRLPQPGDVLAIGPVAAKITGMGAYAWQKVEDLGHVVLNFSGAATTDRPGEICLEAVDPGTVLAVLASGTAISVTRA